MAIGTITLATDRGGNSPSAPVFVYHVDFVGDNNVPSGGSLDFESALVTALGKDVEIIDVVGHGFVTATGALIQWVRWIPATEALALYGITDGVEDTGNQSANTYRVTVFAR